MGEVGQWVGDVHLLRVIWSYCKGGCLSSSKISEGGDIGCIAEGGFMASVGVNVRTPPNF